MKKIIAVFMSAILLLVSACSILPDTDGDPVMHTVGEWDESFSEYEIAASFGDDGYEKNLLWCECDVFDFAISPVEYDVDNNTFYISGDAEFSLKKLKSGDAVLLDIDVPDTFARVAISYKVGGKDYAFAICYNGRDGGIALVEMEL